VTTGWTGAATTGAVAARGTAGTKPDGAATDTAARQQATIVNSDWKRNKLLQNIMVIACWVYT